MEDPDEVWGVRPRRQSPCDKVVEGFGEVKSNLNDLTNGLNLSGNYWICEILNNNLILNFNEIMTSKIVYIGCLNGKKIIILIADKSIEVSNETLVLWNVGLCVLIVFSLLANFLNWIYAKKYVRLFFD